MASIRCSRSPGPTISSVCQRVTAAPTSTASGQAKSTCKGERASNMENTSASTLTRVTAGISRDQLASSREAGTPSIAPRARARVSQSSQSKKRPARRRLKVVGEEGAPCGAEAAGLKQRHRRAGAPLHCALERRHPLLVGGWSNDHERAVPSEPPVLLLEDASQGTRAP